jgi:sec1 family domain-containing protein 1
LDKKIRENLRDTRNNLFLNDSINQNSLSFQRPLLILLDRNFDLATPLHHTWTYQALINDLLNLKLNRVDIEIKSNNSPTGKETKIYDLLPSDKFWKQQKGNPFPVVAESIQEELEKYKQSESELKSLKETIVIILKYFIPIIFQKQKPQRNNF